MGKYFWKVILNNIAESPLILKTAIEKLQANPNKIGVAGHSMGGFTASGVFTSNEKIKALTVFNGSCSWNFTNNKYAELLNIKESPLSIKEQQKIDQLDPISRIEQLKHRPILIVHGEADELVPIEGQRLFYQKISEISNPIRTRYIEYPRLNHYITTNMMEDMIRFFKEELS